MQLHYNNINNTFTVENGIKKYNSHQCFKYLEAQGKQVFGQAFKIYEEDKSVIYKLLIHTIKDKEEAEKLGLHLNKGIFLTGPSGCGKTAIMHLLKSFAQSNNYYKIKTTREITFEYLKKGKEALLPYTHKTRAQPRPLGYCFDDLGAELQIKHFKKDCNIMAKILLNRNQQMLSNEATTHITTKYTLSEMVKHYGKEFQSVIPNMFNIISFQNNRSNGLQSVELK